jgi:hypothetical protein
MVNMGHVGWGLCPDLYKYWLNKAKRPNTANIKWAALVWLIVRRLGRERKAMLNFKF